MLQETRSAVTFFVVCFFCGVLGSEQLDLSTLFYRGEICIGQDDSSWNCLEKIGASRSVLECASSCADDLDCVGVIVDAGKHFTSSFSSSSSLSPSSLRSSSFLMEDSTTISCFKHSSKCSAEHKVCTGGAAETKHDYYSKNYCFNGGQRLSENGKCQCIGGWVGDTCQKHPRTCLELGDNGYPAGNQKAVLDPDGTGLNLIPSNCFFWGNYYHILIMISRAELNLNKTWVEYRDGFADSNSKETWLGLENWHLLSLQGYQKLTLKVDVKNVGVFHRIYYGFKVASESQKFLFSFDSTEEIIEPRGDALRDMGFKLGDCFGDVMDVAFSAWDKDYDRDDSDNCASLSGSGWWFKTCNRTCNVFGFAPMYWDSMDIAPNERMHVLGMNMTRFQKHKVVISMLLQ